MYSQGNVFTGGINTDDEDRFLPDGDFRDSKYSRNYGINTSDEGALQSMTGNRLRGNTQLAAGLNIIIGSCEDIEGKYSNDTGNIILFVYNDQGNHSIWRYNTYSLSYTLILQDELLNFKLDYPIYHAAVVDGLLYWTDNYFNSYELDPAGVPDFNPPRKINIQKAILYTESGGTDPDGYTEITFDNLDWVKHPPLFSPSPAYYTDVTETVNNLKNKLFQFRYQYIYDDREPSAWSPISDLILPPSGESIAQTVNIDPYVDNTINITFNTGSTIVKNIRVAFRIGNINAFYLYKEFNKEEEGWTDYNNVTISFKNETAGPAISDFERNYDLVPQIAKCVEYLPSNEFAIGNIIEGYDKPIFSESDFGIEINRYKIEDTAFTYPKATFENWYLGGTRSQYIDLDYALPPLTGETVGEYYRYQPGDIICLQLKDITFSQNNANIPDPVIYYTVPEIDDVTYPTDNDKLQFLRDDLTNYLTGIGVSAYTTIAPSRVYLNSKTWYNQTEYQLDPTGPDGNGSTNNIYIIRNNNANRTFKTGAKHEFAIQYYDRANRDGTAITFPLNEIYNPFYSDLTDTQLNTSLGANREPFFTTMTLSIYAIPPIWATHYQILYKPSTNISNFQQRSVIKAVYNPDTTVKLYLDNYYKQNFIGASINQTPSKGDFVRFVRKRALLNGEENLFKYAVQERDDTRIVFNNGISTGSIYTVNDYYDFYGNIISSNPNGTFIPSITQSYRVQAFSQFEIDWDGLPLSINTFTMNLYLYNITTATTTLLQTITRDSVTKNNPENTFVFNYTNNLILNAGENYGLIFDFEAADPVPLIVDFKVYSVQASFKVGEDNLDYSNYSYYPEYITNSIQIPLDLNVLEYNPGDEGESESVTVNYFDISLLGDYLRYGGSSENRGFASGGFQIEIYTPKKETENDPWYEVGIEFDVLNPHTSERSHAGNTNQVPGIQEAIVNLDCGDVYIRQRVMATGYKYDGAYEDVYNAADTRAAWFCEDPHYSDYYISNWNDKGRIAISSPFAKREIRKTTVYHTNSYIDNSQINGLSRVEVQNQVSLKDEHGGINKLIQIGDTLKTLQDRKVSSIYVQKSFALNGDGTNNVIISDRTFSTIRPNDDDYGCIHTGSVSRIENTVYFYDYFNAAFLKITSGGIFNICEGSQKFSKGVRDFTSRINGLYGNYKTANIWSHINRSNNEYAIYVTEGLSNLSGLTSVFSISSIEAPNTLVIPGNYTSILTEGVSVYVSQSDIETNNGVFSVVTSNYNSIKDVTVITVDANLEDEDPGPGKEIYLTVYSEFQGLKGEGLVYNYVRDRWISRLNHGAIFATQFGVKPYSTGGSQLAYLGNLFEENVGDELTFYNGVKQQLIQFVFNEAPMVVKRFYTHLQRANFPFEVSVEVPANQTYPTGMSSDIPSAVLKNQEGYFVSRYFRDLNDPRYSSPLEARLNGRELRGYVLRHTLTNSDSTNKKILMAVNINFAPSEPIIQ